MSKLMLKASVNAKVWANTSVERMKARADRDRGQGSVEYLGIIVVVVAIIAALMLTNIGSDDRYCHHRADQQDHRRTK